MTKMKNITFGRDMAPEYSKREKWRYLLIRWFWVVPLYGVAQFWWLPELDDQAANLQCLNYGAFTAAHLLFYGLFLGFPLAVAVPLLIYSLLRGHRVLKAGQDPLPAEKVFRPTPYRYGVRACVKYLLLFCLGTLLLCFMVPGTNYAQQNIEMVNAKSCEASEH